MKDRRRAASVRKRRCLRVKAPQSGIAVAAVKEGDTVVGSRTKVKIAKNKGAGPFFEKPVARSSPQ
jgi:hypothetical protein